MCITLKYEVWNVNQPEAAGVNALTAAGYPPLAAMVLAARGINGPKAAEAYLDCHGPMPEPYLMRDMDLAAGRVGLAMARGERIAVFGDYDVDGITSTCLLTDFLRKNGADVVSYIPARLEEGYGLNPIAIHSLHDQGVKLIVTVDCGITAIAEAQLCKELGMELVITDHHECKDRYPEAVAVVDPHRPDHTYPHQLLSGVGVAFKLASALCGSQEEVLEHYGDMVCLGTVADVMPLQGENRLFVQQGLAQMRERPRPGIAALIQESGLSPEQLNATAIGFTLAPRINAAGRMGNIDLAVELFLTKDPERAAYLARALCNLNRRRQNVETEIYKEAVSMLPQDKAPEAIVLADDQWHQGVVGIVASRMAEEYCCPTFLVCLDGDHGKASSRSYGGFNLFAALNTLSPLLESYGGHELAAGFTIRREQIDEFRRQVGALAAAYYSDSVPRTQLAVDCAIPPELLTVKGIDALEVLEPCGNGCPKPVLMMKNLTVDRITPVGNGRHLRLRLLSGHHVLNGIFFSTTAQALSIEVGDLVDAAFTPQVNEFRGERTPQLNLIDLRPSCAASCSEDASGYRALKNGTPDPQFAESLTPDRGELGAVWRYLAACQPVRETPMCLCRKIVRRSGKPLSLGKLLVCLDIFEDVGLIQQSRRHKEVIIQLLPTQGKTDLSQSRTLRLLTQGKES